MKRKRAIPLDFEIDKLTNSIENVLTGDSFRSEVILVTNEDIKAITKKMGGALTGNMNLKNPTGKCLNSLLRRILR